MLHVSFRLSVGAKSMNSTLSDRQAIWAFVVGCVAVTAGVCAHLPMVAMAKSMNYRLAGMPIDGLMLGGMALIVIGTVTAAYGLLPRNIAAQQAAAANIMITAPPSPSASFTARG